jgi:hypothetical protein
MFCIRIYWRSVLSAREGYVWHSHQSNSLKGNTGDSAIINFSTSNNIVIIMYYKYNIISEASPFKIEKNEPDNDDTL